MTMVAQAAGAPVTPQEALQAIMCDCHRNTPRAADDDCRSHGEKKHECCEAAIQNHQAPPEIGGERGYSPTGKPLTQTRQQLKAAGGLRKGMSFPDACAMNGGQPTQFFDFKFPCGGEADADFYFPPGRSQFDKYLKLSQKLNMTLPPVPLTSRSC